jgi:hypothetical protein
MRIEAAAVVLYGPRFRRDSREAIGVLQARDNHTPIGMALGTGWDERGVQLWRLIVQGAEVPGRWVVVDREFHPAPESGRGPRG